MINWNSITITSPDPLWQIAKALKRPDCKKGREIVLQIRAKRALEIEGLCRGD